MSNINRKAFVGRVSPILDAAFGGLLIGATVKVIANKVMFQPSSYKEKITTTLSSRMLPGKPAVTIRLAEFF